MPVREKRRGSPKSPPVRMPSHVPSHPQTAAKVRGFSPTASEFTAETDWLLEESGFELLVPSAISSWIGWVPEPLFGRIRALCRGYSEFGCRTVSLDDRRGMKRGAGAAVDRSLSGSAGHSLQCSGIHTLLCFDGRGR